MEDFEEIWQALEEAENRAAEKKRKEEEEQKQMERDVKVS